jgi:hypothetical protein
MVEANAASKALSLAIDNESVVIPFDLGGADPHERKSMLRDRWIDATRAVENALTATGAIEPGIPNGQSRGISRLLHQQFIAESNYVTFFENRITRLERTLRKILASDAIDGTQREEVFTVLLGRAKVGRDPKMLTDTEKELIENYRTMAVDEKQIIRTLARKLSVDGISVHGK